MAVDPHAERILDLPDEPFITTRYVEDGVLRSTVRSIRATAYEQLQAELAAYRRQLPYLEQRLALVKSREFWGGPDSQANRTLTDEQHALAVEDAQKAVDAEKAEIAKLEATIGAIDANRAELSGEKESLGAPKTRRRKAGSLALDGRAAPRKIARAAAKLSGE